MQPDYEYLTETLILRVARREGVSPEVVRISLGLDPAGVYKSADE